ncbi:AraC family transcriptional regulator [Streptomyces sp. Act143]|uniref:AraC family transcriptional regulator n=1 Tax=Streptomyces sp. Act143 TaxID=2200760 RepID=UPI000D67A38E|nr:AraC family transcriptional regulator [Streptomyces sp. Act143]PWI13573.1 AraC family transcriptional regulator [Streptomyces sp. Act143]
MTVVPDRTADFSSYATRSPEEAHEAIAAHYYDMNLQVIGPTEDFATSLSVLNLGSLTVGDICFGTEIRCGFAEPGAYHVAVPVRGCFSVQQGRGDVVFATEGSAVFFDPSQHIRIDAWSPDCQALTVKIDRSALHLALESLLDRPLSRPPVFGPSVDVRGGPGRSWAGLATWALLDKDTSLGLLRQPLIRSRIEQTLLEGVLLAAEHTHREELEAPAPPMRPASVKRVMDAVQERPAEAYDATRLAQLARVSVRTLQEAFRRHVGMSPMAYVYDVRLQRVRDELRAAGPGTTTVSDVAHRWGFVHLGRFASRYRERFGETPSRTLRGA